VRVGVTVTGLRWRPIFRHASTVFQPRALELRFTLPKSCACQRRIFFTLMLQGVWGHEGTWRILTLDSILLLHASQFAF
jgi:hypothetical protein